MNYIKVLYPVEGVPGENPDMAWVARGPSNVAGRTNGMMFDPNDATNKRFCWRCVEEYL